eukprot:366512-Chlamydomonas_euryale.AAC.28
MRAGAAAAAESTSAAQTNALHAARSAAHAHISACWSGAGGAPGAAAAPPHGASSAHTWRRTSEGSVSRPQALSVAAAALLAGWMA